MLFRHEVEKREGGKRGNKRPVNKANRGEGKNHSENRNAPGQGSQGGESSGAHELREKGFWGRGY